MVSPRPFAWQATIALLSVLVGLLLLSGLLDSRGEADGNDRVNRVGKVLPLDAAPLQHQVFRFLLKEPTSLDIGVVTYNANDTQFLFERLVMLNESNQLVPGAAERWESNPEGTRWTFHLRVGAHWSDGRPVTAQDWVYSYKRLLDPTSGNAFAFFYYDIKGARAFNQGLNKDPASLGIYALDRYTFVIETEGPCPYLPYITSFPTSAPVPRWQVERFGEKWTEPGHCVSNSSYKLVDWVHGRDMTYQLNEHYNGPNPGYLEKIVGIFYTGLSPGTFPYENNEVDRHILDAQDMARIQSDPVLSQQLHLNPFPATWYIFFRTEKPPFDDLRVRQAIAHAIDRQAICRVVLSGTGTPAYTMIPPGLPGYVTPKYKHLQVYDVARAQQLLREAGYPGGRGFPRVEMWLRNASPTIRAVAEAIQGMLQENLGIAVVIKDQERKVYTDNMVRREIPMSLIGYAYDYPDPSDMLGLVWHSQPVGYGRHDWNNERFDQLVEQAAGEMDPTQRMALYDEAERVLAENCGGVFVFHTVTAELRKPWLKGVKTDQWGNRPLLIQNTTFMDLYIGKEILAVKGSE